MLHACRKQAGTSDILCTDSRGLVQADPGADLILKKLHKEYLKVQYSDWKPGDIKYFDIDFLY